MNKKLLSLVFEIISFNLHIKWDDVYLVFLHRSILENEKDMTSKILHLIIEEGIIFNDYSTLEDLYKEQKEILVNFNLYDLIEEILNLWKTNKTRKIKKQVKRKFFVSQKNKKKHRYRKIRKICDCCHEYVLTCEEIQNFPQKNEESYILEKFNLALAQDDKNKRVYLLERLVCEYASSNVKDDYSLLFEIWEKAENEGAHFEAIEFNYHECEIIFNSKYLRKFLSIIKFRHNSHDDFIQNMIIFLLKRKRFAMAFYIGSKISSDERRLISAITTALELTLDDESIIDQVILFLNKTYYSVIHNLEKQSNQKAIG